VNFDPDFDAPDRPGLISRQEAAELAGMKTPPGQLSEHNTVTWSDGMHTDYTATAAVLSRAAKSYIQTVDVNWSTYGGWNKLGTITSDSMRFGRLEPTEEEASTPPDDAATRALKARQARNTGPKRPDAGHSKRKRKHRG
jgi:hypothetical protein